MALGVSIFANLMTRAIRFGNYGVYVRDERRAQHHQPHAHIKNRGAVVASVYLVTLTIYDQVEPIPRTLVELIEERQIELVDLWARLNDE